MAAIYLAAEFDEPMTAGQVYRYERAKLAMLTGWTLEVIDRLGLADRSDLLQVYEGEQSLRRGK